MPLDPEIIISDFAKKLASVAVNQYDRFHLFSENDPELAAQIKHYWNDLHAATKNLPNAGRHVDSFRGVGTAWSAVFVSWCVLQAGASTSQFFFSAAHSVFVHDMINHPGMFEGHLLSEHAPRVGDIIQNNRGGTHHDFAFAKNNEFYSSHSAIVVEKGQDQNGKYVLTIGGNESDSVRRKRVKLHDDGTVVQRATDPYICVLRVTV